VAPRTGQHQTEDEIDEGRPRDHRKAVGPLRQDRKTGWSGLGLDTVVWTHSPDTIAVMARFDSKAFLAIQRVPDVLRKAGLQMRGLWLWPWYDRKASPCAGAYAAAPSDPICTIVARP